MLMTSLRAIIVASWAPFADGRILPFQFHLTVLLLFWTMISTHFLLLSTDSSMDL